MVGLPNLMANDGSAMAKTVHKSMKLCQKKNTLSRRKKKKKHNKVSQFAETDSIIGLV